MFRALLVSLGISSLLSACAVPTNSPEQNSFQEFGGYFKVLSVNDYGAFAMHCDRKPLGGSCFGETVFIPKTEDPLLYDGKLIHMKHPTVIKVLEFGQDHAAYHIPVFIDKDRNDTAK